MKAISLKNQPKSRHLRGLDFRRVRPLFRSVPTPFMLLRTGRVRENLDRLRRALPGVGIYYAVKANDHPAIVTALREEGCRFDISSIRELERVIDCGGRVENAIHTNPVKMIAEFDAAVEMGVRTFVADNLSELDKFSRYEGRAGVLLRFKTDGHGSIVNLSLKFGAEAVDLPALLDRLIALNLPFRGFCFHVGSQCTNVDLYAQSIAVAGKLIALARDRGLNPEILDIGGGFPIEYTTETPDIETVGRAVTTALEQHIDPAIGIICEPGRYLCGDAVTLFASVIGRSRRDGAAWYYLDDGLYGSFSGRLYDHGVYPILTSRNTTWEKAVLAGPTCDSFDVIYDDCLMPPLEIGDILVFPAMGAYCSVSATEFNGLRQARAIAVDW